ncbi:hypothetical protein B0H13DRAFT_1855592 [Mycena leptocephala]|nr:hypothetical protein B0H13DRAFT_1855592 [Mycena leptocephala]
MARAKSKMKPAQIARETRDALQARAVALLWKDFSLDPRTLLRHVNGGKPLSVSNAEKGWLLPEEVDTIIKFATEVANRGFPLRHKRIKEAVDEICRARLGAAFPPTHSNRLSIYWSYPLDNMCGHAVNPATNTAWFDL